MCWGMCMSEGSKEAGGCGSARGSVPVSLGCLRCLDIEREWTEKHAGTLLWIACKNKYCVPNRMSSRGKKDTL